MVKMKLILCFGVLLPITAFGQVDETAKTRHVFPQLADGRGWGSYVVTMNVSDVDAECTMSPYGVSLSRFADSPDLNKGITAATYTVPLLGGNAIFATTGTSTTLQSGYLTLACSRPVTAQLVYVSTDFDFGFTIGLATVFSSQPGTLFSTPLLLDTDAGLRLGLAVANDGFLSTSCTVTVVDKEGVSLGEDVLTIPGRTNVARFVDEFGVGIPSELFRGSLALSCDRQVSVIGLLFDGIVFTTVPLTVFLP